MFHTLAHDRFVGTENQLWLHALQLSLAHRCRPTKNYLFILVTFLRYWRLKNFFFNLKRFHTDDLGFLFMGVK